MGAHATSLIALLAALGLAGSSATVASAETRPRFGGSLEASLLGEPAVRDPQDATSHAEITLADMLFDGLYRVDDAGAVIPELAAGPPSLSDDQLEVTVPVRVGVAFHDGHTLEVADVVASLKRLRRSALNGWLVAPVVDIVAQGDAVVLKLKYPAPQLAAHLAAPAAAITRGGRTPRRGRMQGTGPFVLHRTGAKAMRLRAFDKHHRGRSYLDRIRLRWFTDPDVEARDYEVGRSHVSFRGATAYPGHRPKYRTHSLEGPATILTYVGLGRAHPRILGNRDFRRALSAALNRRSMRTLGSGERVVPTMSPEAQALGGPRPPSSALKGQLRRAKQLLASAATQVPTLRAGGSPPTLEILVDRSRVDDRDVADKVLASLFRLDVPARVVELSAHAFNRRVRAGSCDLYIGQLSPQVATNQAELVAAFSAGGDSWARGKLAVAPLDLRQARAQFAARLPIIPLFHRTVRVHHRSDVHGIRFEGSGQLVWADVYRFGRAKRN